MFAIFFRSPARLCFRSPSASPRLLDVLGAPPMGEAPPRRSRCPVQGAALLDPVKLRRPPSTHITGPHREDLHHWVPAPQGSCTDNQAHPTLTALHPEALWGARARLRIAGSAATTPPKEATPPAKPRCSLPPPHRALPPRHRRHRPQQDLPGRRRLAAICWINWALGHLVSINLKN
jgi:hypothetical protein